MDYRNIFASCLFLSAVACGGSEKSVNEPTQLAETETTQASHLSVVPFVMTTTGIKADGTATEPRIIRGNADGLISIEEDGTTKDILKVTSDGILTRLSDESGDTLRFDDAGTFHINDVPVKEMRIGNDGTVYSGDKEFARIENGKVIDVTGELLKSTFSFNGNTQITTYEIVIEGGPEAQQLAGVLLGLQLLPGKATAESETYENPPEPAVAPTPAP